MVCDTPGCIRDDGHIKPEACNRPCALFINKETALACEYTTFKGDGFVACVRCGFPPDKHPNDDTHVEAVDHPAHYGGADNPYEAIKVIEAWDLDFYTGNAVKYVARAGKKGGKSKEIEDLRKAVWYLHYKIDRLTSQVAGDKT